jgi:general secretion pathway protein K
MRTQPQRFHEARLVRRRGNARRRRGFALMLVIWAIMMMSFAVMGVVNYVSYGMDENVLKANQFRALHLAECGIALGLHPQVKPGDPALKQDTGTDSGFEVLISSEGARIPINYITDAGYRDAVYNLFVYWGLSPDEANTAADSLADWVDADSDQRSQGAEADYYKGQGFPDFPRNQGFASVEEMILVKGMSAVERAKPDWRNYFSVYGDGLIDLNYAPKDVLIAVCNVQDNDADNLIRERNGADGLPGTQDDPTLNDAQAQSLLGLDAAKYASLKSRITTDGLIRRVESTGRTGEQKYKVVVIAKRQTDGSLNYLARTEE